MNSNQEKAKNLFMQALNHERDENFLKATKFYQQAVKLYPNVLKTCINDNPENVDKNESVEGNKEGNNTYLISVITENFYSIIKLLFSCKSIYSLRPIENEYKRLCNINFTNCEEKSYCWNIPEFDMMVSTSVVSRTYVYTQFLFSNIVCKSALKDIGNIHLDPKDKERVIYNPCVVTYFRYLLFLNESNKVLIVRSEVNKKEVLEVLKISYEQIKKWNLSVSNTELIKDLLKFQGKVENSLIKRIRIGEYTFDQNEKTVEIHYPELLNEPCKYNNIIQLRLHNYMSANNNMLKWISFKILSKIKMNYSEDTLNIDNRQYRSFFFFNLKFLSHLFITRIPES
ncbi:DNA replication origin binding protein, putative (DIA2) [Plasmodium ovale curtisi]|uniref:DNA replication origin binding protein, putative (DIA2) n=1 Tax=Plasmodium ovale curtisi TaxID=864141 RepID=A0A1A8X224_PLAOA|nr:DNA replication origin binding protein, putative (DIA2) [Plasmodium ovale curtisi]SBS98641.1 DNA replication origin binding protein, putative (DIA2) [Plasmodium ovale curtisi]